MATKKSGTNGVAKKKILATKTDHLPVPLTEPELREAGKQLAHLEGDLAAQTASEKDIKDGLKAKRSALEMRISLLANTIRAGLEYRPIPVRVEADFEDGVVREIREDTGATVSTRPVTEQDRQSTLFPVSTKPAPTSLVWHRQGDDQVAEVADGVYCVEPDADGYFVYWTKKGSGTKRIGAESDEGLAEDLAERHNVERAASAILSNAGDGRLTKEARS
jgi:hypothetical protein